MHEPRDNFEASSEGLRIAIVTSRYHEAITGALRDGAVSRYAEGGGDVATLRLIDVPGTFELTAICRELAGSHRFDAIVAIGCVITGETTHDRYICEAIAQGLTQITVNTGVPIAFGVLTCQNYAQAEARAGGAKGNKGEEAMNAAIECARTIEDLRYAERADRAVAT